MVGSGVALGWAWIVHEENTPATAATKATKRTGVRIRLMLLPRGRSDEMDRSGNTGSKILQRPLQTFAEGDLGLPAEEGAGTGDIGAAARGIVLR